MSEYDLKNEEMATGDSKIVAEAKRRFNYCQEYESRARQLELDDIKFGHGDSDNHYQWPNEIRARLRNKPILTVNKARQHCLQIINEGAQNPHSIKYRPTGGDATFEAAETFEGIARHIEYRSNATAVYNHGRMYQVFSGIGYWRVVTDWSDEDSFDQDIFIRKIKDPRCVYIDSNTKEIDGLDAKYAFIFDDVPKEVFKEEYPDYANVPSSSTLGTTIDDWIKSDSIRVAEYFRAVSVPDTLIHIPADKNSPAMTAKASDLGPELSKKLMADSRVQSREIEGTKIEWFLIAGSQIVDRRDWPGKYIPIVRLIGEELEIEGTLHRAGHIRYLKDAQRMYNYWTSAATEAIALQTKVPWIAPKAAVQSGLNYWKNANNENYAVLTYDHMDSKGQPIPPPFRPDPPQMPDAYMKGMQTSANELMMASGQYQATMGQNGNEISGKAINERQQQGETATAHFAVQEAISITATGKILLDLIPKVYDVPRVVKILAKDGSQSEVQIDPNAQQAYMQQQAKTQEEATAIFNPNIGNYSVQADIGPSYATQRQEAWNAMTQILAHNEALTPLIGDLLFKNGDFPGADEIAKRLERMVPPQAKGDGADPQVIQMQQQMQMMQQETSKLLQELSTERLKLKGKEQQKDINVYEALTKRMDVLFKHHGVPAADTAKMLHDVMMEEHKASLAPIIDANAPELKQEAQP